MGSGSSVLEVGRTSEVRKLRTGVRWFYDGSYVWPQTTSGIQHLDDNKREEGELAYG